MGTDPLNPDTDGDGMPDGFEVFYGLNPLDPTDAGKPSKANDGLTNLQEYQGGTDPTNPDRTVPSVSSVTPANGATNPPINTLLVLVFNKPILNPSQIAARAKLDVNVTGFSVASTGGGQTVGGTATVSSDGTQLVFDPSVNLAITTTYTLTASGFRTLAGVPASASFTSTFTTNNQTDTSPPTITRTSPFNGMSGVPLNSPYSVEFSKQIDTTSLSTSTFALYDAVAGKLAGRVVVDGTGRIATFIPANPLAAGRVFTVRLSQSGQITDLGGNSLSPVTYSFTSGFAADLTVPSVTDTSPENGDAGISVNTQIVIQFSKTISEITAVRGVQITQNGTPVPGSFSFQDNDTQVVFNATNPLGPGATTVTTAQGVTDVAGNVLSNPAAYTFTVDTPADTVRPSLTLANPPNGTTGVGRNVTIQAEFSERINQLTASSSTFYVYDSNTGNRIPGTITVDPTRRSATFAPATAFVADTRYCWVVNTNVTDLAGNAFNAFTYCFTTGTAIDTTPPSVTQVNPPNGATGVPLNALIVAQVNQPLNAFAFQNQTGGVVLPLNTSAANAFDLGPFPGGAVIALTANGHGDLGVAALQINPDGSLFAPATGSYTYANAGSTSYPTVNGGDGVNHFSGGGLNYNSVVNPPLGFAGSTTTDTTDPAAIRFGTLVGTFKSQPGALDWFVIGYGKTVTVPASGADLYLAVNDNNNSNNNGSYNVNVKTASLTPAITLSAGGQTVPGISSLSSDGLSLSYTPVSQLTASTSYTINIQGATDYVGNTIKPFSSGFTTGTTTDTSQPIVLSFNPPTGTKTVPVNSQVVITFSKKIDPITVNTASSRLVQQSNGFQIAGTYSVDNSGANGVVTFAPSALLPSGAVIVLTVVGNQVEDFAGNGTQAASASFTTAGTADTTPPTVTSVTPTNGSTDLGLNATVSITFSKPLNPNTVNSNTFSLFNGTTRLATGIGSTPDHQTVNLTASLPNAATIGVAATSGVNGSGGESTG